MDEYPDPEDEYDLLHQEEMELMREMEEDEVSMDMYYKPMQSRNSLNFENVSEKKDDSNAKNIEATQNEIRIDKENITPVENDSSQKKGFSKRFLSCDSLLDIDTDLQIVERPAKKRKTNENVPASVRTETITHNQFGVTSLRVPKWAFMPVSTDSGERIYVKVKHEDLSDMSKHVNAKNYAYNLLGDSYQKIKREAEKIQGLSYKRMIEMEELSNSESSDVEVLTESSDLWVEKFKPKRYLELLSDESVNRTLLNWLKMWDKVVFNKEFKPKSRTDEKKKEDFNQKYKFNLQNELDADGRPQYKIALLCGPPGLGKTTLAHVIAAIAGYNVIEVNASDDRSPEVFHTKLEAATKMHTVNGSSKPNCLILDEIDGAPTQSIDYLLQYINGKVNEKTKKGKKGKPQGAIKRPVICICNEPYVPSLRNLRQQAYVVHFPSTSCSKLAQRLLEICKKQNIKTDLSTLTMLCEKTQSDIRSCISTLHFFKTKNGQTFKVSDVAKSEIGQKDLQKGLFTLWQEIFQTPIKKDNKFSGTIANINAQEKAMMEFNYNAQNMERLKHVVHVMQSAGDFERLMQGVYENFLKMKFSRSKHAIMDGLEWFCWADRIDTSIRSEQNFVLMPYLPYSFAAWHFLFSTPAFSKIMYPNQGYENHMKTMKCKQILNDVIRGLAPSVRSYTHNEQLLLDVLPMFGRILVPNLRPVNTKLFNERERKEFSHLLDVMIDYNLNYIQQRAPDGTYYYQFDPNIDDITRFEVADKSKSGSSFSYNMKQLISREVELEKVRRTESLRKDTVEKPNPSPKPKPKAEAKKEEPKSVHTPERSVPNHLQRLTPKQIKVEDSEPGQYKDFFGRIVKVKKSADSNDASKEKSLVKSKIWFCYKEGFNNAVKKDITIVDIL